ncbi:uncharacterized protein LOC143255997 isoform X2 [Tachypleus tridentatus]|uniref:uncharacterized protein LOC143255997 isoform X2 n=1 Tax=Tachypleus tridentatus TaxID=6853 RepID=UPI003FD1B7B0
MLENGRGGSGDSCSQNTQFDILSFENHLLEVVEELRLKREETEKHHYQKLEEMDRETRDVKKSFEDQLYHFKEEKAKNKATIEVQEKEITRLKEEARRSQMNKLELENKFKEQETRLQIQQNRYENVTQQLSRLHQLQNRLTQSCQELDDTQRLLKDSVTEAVQLNKRLTRVNHQQNATIKEIQNESFNLSREVIELRMELKRKHFPKPLYAESQTENLKLKIQTQKIQEEMKHLKELLKFSREENEKTVVAFKRANEMVQEYLEHLKQTEKEKDTIQMELKQANIEIQKLREDFANQEVKLYKAQENHQDVVKQWRMKELMKEDKCNKDTQTKSPEGKIGVGTQTMLSSSKLHLVQPVSEGAIKMNKNSSKKDQKDDITTEIGVSDETYMCLNTVSNEEAKVIQSNFCTDNSEVSHGLQKNQDNMCVLLSQISDCSPKSKCNLQKVKADDFIQNEESSQLQDQQETGFDIQTFKDNKEAVNIQSENNKAVEMSFKSVGNNNESYLCSAVVHGSDICVRQDCSSLMNKPIPELYENRKTDEKFSSSYKNNAEFQFNGETLVSKCSISVKGTVMNDKWISKNINIEPEDIITLSNNSVKNNKISGIGRTFNILNQKSLSHIDNKENIIGQKEVTQHLLENEPLLLNYSDTSFVSSFPKCFNNELSCGKPETSIFHEEVAQYTQKKQALTFTDKNSLQTSHSNTQSSPSIPLEHSCQVCAIPTSTYSNTSLKLITETTRSSCVTEKNYNTVHPCHATSQLDSKGNHEIAHLSDSASNCYTTSLTATAAKNNCFSENSLMYSNLVTHKVEKKTVLAKDNTLKSSSQDPDMTMNDKDEPLLHISKKKEFVQQTIQQDITTDNHEKITVSISNGSYIKNDLSSPKGFVQSVALTESSSIQQKESNKDILSLTPDEKISSNEKEKSKCVELHQMQSTHTPKQDAWEPPIKKPKTL